MADTTQDILNELGAQYQGGGEFGTRKSEQMPAGTAVMRITNAYLDRSSQKKRKQLSITTECLEHSEGAEIAGKSYTKSWGLEDAQNFEWLNGDLLNLNFEPIKNASVLAQRLQQLIKDLPGVCFRCTFQENKDPQYPPQMYINAGARRTDLEGKPTKTGNLPI